MDEQTEKLCLYLCLYLNMFIFKYVIRDTYKNIVVLFVVAKIKQPKCST
jgi:hypothetical protein